MRCAMLFHLPCPKGRGVNLCSRLSRSRGWACSNVRVQVMLNYDLKPNHVAKLLARLVHSGQVSSAAAAAAGSAACGIAL